MQVELVGGPKDGHRVNLYVKGHALLLPRPGQPLADYYRPRLGDPTRLDYGGTRPFGPRREQVK